jgi:16S rRNA G966 N2-methylase RsmD/predicted transcriptional regulator
LWYNRYRPIFIEESGVDTLQIKQFTRAEKRDLVIERLKKMPELGDMDIAHNIGVSRSFVWKIRQELIGQGVLKKRENTNDDSWSRHPYLVANKELLAGLSEKSLIALRTDGVLSKMQEIGSLSPRYAQRLLHKERKAANKSTAVNILESDVKVFQADIRSGLPEIADGSVQLCFVDIPYHRRAIEELTPHIAMTASRILSDGGSLLLMVGGSHLNIVLEKLTQAADKSLRFQWDILYVCPRGTPLIQGRRVTTAVKHIIWMVKGKYSGPIQHDLIFAPPDPDNADKELYYHGQSTVAVREILERWSSSGDTICDFMCGGGSVAVAAHELGGRKLILSDINPEAVAITKKRIAEILNANRGQVH